MSNGYAVIPLDDGHLAKESIDWIQGEMVFVADNLPRGRFPTQAELRQVILDLGYNLEEALDWFVTSDDDYTAIWFRKDENQPDEGTISFSFHKGADIVLDIMQQVSNQCGTFLVIDEYGSTRLVIVPDSVFPEVPQPQKSSGYRDVISGRMATMIARLDKAKPQETLFLLSHIREILRHYDYPGNYELQQSAQQGVGTYGELLKHPDERARYLAFDLVASFQQRFYEYATALAQALKHEIDPDTKARMIWALERRITDRVVTRGEIDEGTKAILDTLLELSEDARQSRSVRLAASQMLVRAQPGFLTPTIRTLLIDALTQPEAYKAIWESIYSVSYRTLKTIEKLLLHHRIDILRSALPQMTMAQDAHDVLRDLLDHVFFGEIRNLWMGSLPDDYEAERPMIEETRFRENRSRNWLYPVNPTRLTAEELMPFQREILEMVIALDLPWMAHSNLLEKYGLPPTRQALRALLASRSQT